MYRYFPSPVNLNRINYTIDSITEMTFESLRIEFKRNIFYTGVSVTEPLSNLRSLITMTEKKKEPENHLGNMIFLNKGFFPVVLGSKHRKIIYDSLTCHRKMAGR